MVKAIRRPLGLWLVALAVYAFLYVPLIIVVVYSFNHSQLNVEWLVLRSTGTASCFTTTKFCALMAFTLSIDDFVITFFTAGANASTLLLRIYSMIKIAVMPEVNVALTLLRCLTLMIIIISSKLASNAIRFS